MWNSTLIVVTVACGVAVGQPPASPAQPPAQPKPAADPKMAAEKSRKATGDALDAALTAGAKDAFPDDYKKVVNTLAEADKAFRDGEYAAATLLYDRASVRFKELGEKGAASQAAARAAEQYRNMRGRFSDEVLKEGGGVAWAKAQREVARSEGAGDNKAKAEALTAARDALAAAFPEIHFNYARAQAEKKPKDTAAAVAAILNVIKYEPKHAAVPAEFRKVAADPNYWLERAAAEAKTIDKQATRLLAYQEIAGAARAARVGEREAAALRQAADIADQLLDPLVAVPVKLKLADHDLRAVKGADVAPVIDAIERQVGNIPDKGVRADLYARTAGLAHKAGDKARFDRLLKLATQNNVAATQSPYEADYAALSIETLAYAEAGDVPTAVARVDALEAAVLKHQSNARLQVEKWLPLAFARVARAAAFDSAETSESVYVRYSAAALAYAVGVNADGGVYSNKINETRELLAAAAARRGRPSVAWVAAGGVADPERRARCQSNLAATPPAPGDLCTEYQKVAGQPTSEGRAAGFSGLAVALSGADGAGRADPPYNPSPEVGAMAATLDPGDQAQRDKFSETAGKAPKWWLAHTGRQLDSVKDPAVQARLWLELAAGHAALGDKEGYRLAARGVHASVARGWQIMTSGWTFRRQFDGIWYWEDDFNRNDSDAAKVNEMLSVLLDLERVQAGLKDSAGGAETIFLALHVLTCGRQRNASLGAGVSGSPAELMLVRFAGRMTAPGDRATAERFRRVAPMYWATRASGVPHILDALVAAEQSDLAGLTRRSLQAREAADKKPGTYNSQSAAIAFAEVARLAADAGDKPAFDAAAEYVVGLTRHPNYPVSTAYLAELAAAAARLGRVEQAQGLLERSGAADLKPERVRVEIVRTLVRQGDLNEAGAVAKKLRSEPALATASVALTAAEVRASVAKPDGGAVDLYGYLEKTAKTPEADRAAFAVGVALGIAVGKGK